MPWAWTVHIYVMYTVQPRQRQSTSFKDRISLCQGVFSNSTQLNTPWSVLTLIWCHSCQQVGERDTATKFRSHREYSSGIPDFDQKLKKCIMRDVNARHNTKHKVHPHQRLFSVGDICPDTSLCLWAVTTHQVLPWPVQWEVQTLQPIFPPRHEHHCHWLQK